MEATGLGSDTVPMALQRLLARGVVVATLMYGAELTGETGSPHSRQAMQKAEQCLRATACRALRVWRVSTTGVLREFGIPSVQEHLDGYRAGFLIRILSQNASAAVRAAAYGGWRIMLLEDMDTEHPADGNWCRWTVDMLLRLGLDELIPVVEEKIQDMSDRYSVATGEYWGLMCETLYRLRRDKEPDAAARARFGQPMAAMLLRECVMTHHARVAETSVCTHRTLRHLYARLAPPRLPDGHVAMARYLTCSNARSRRCLTALRLDTGALRASADCYTAPPVTPTDDNTAQTPSAENMCPLCSTTSWETVEHVTLEYCPGAKHVSRRRPSDRRVAQPGP